jgi:hypothetical protein
MVRFGTIHTFVQYKLNSGIMKLGGYYGISSQVLALVYNRGLNEKYCSNRRIS